MAEGYVHVLAPQDVPADKPLLGKAWRPLFIVSLVVGVAALAVSYLLGMQAGDQLRRFFFSYLTALCYGVSLGLGALFFVILQHLTRASWSVVIRRVAELLAALLPLLGLLALPIIIAMLGGDNGLYFWGNPALADGSSPQFDELVAHKAGYLNVGFFSIRMVAYFVIWGLLSWHFLGRSTRQDGSGDARLTLGMWRLSAPAMLLFALTLTGFTIDAVMSLDAHWFSTIIGAYFFAGCALCFLAVTTLSIMLLQLSGRMRRTVTVEHYHDLGKLLFAFTLFWGYIAFSQFMLYWYANIPEETGWYLRRFSGEWLWWSVALLFVQLLIPLAGLLSRYVKRRKRFLAFWCVWLLIAHYMDLYWLIMPEYGGEGIPFGALDVLCLVGVLALMLAAWALLARRRPLVPLGDPALADSLRFENV